MPEMGRCRFYRRVCADEAVRGQSDSRRHSQACLQNTPDEARNIRVIHIRSGAFRFSLVAGAETGLSDLINVVATGLWPVHLGALFHSKGDAPEARGYNGFGFM